MKKLIFALPAVLLLAGCETALNSGHVISVTSTVLGLRVAQQTQNETPELDFGYSRQTVVLEPTITNQTINVPNVANTFGFENPSLFDFGLNETFASGNYQTGNGTNPISAQPIAPAPTTLVPPTAGQITFPAQPVPTPSFIITPTATAMPVNNTNK